MKNALPNVLIPYGQTDITIELAPTAEIVGFAQYGGDGSFTGPTLTDMTLYVNNIFMHPEIVRIFMRKFSFSLIRVHGHHKSPNLTDASGALRLKDLKWPTETLYLAFKPQSNLGLSQFWHKSSQLDVNSFSTPVSTRNSGLVTVATGSGVTAATTNSVTLIHVSGPALSAVDDFYIGYDLFITGGTGYNADDITRNRYIIVDYVGATNLFTIAALWNGATPDSTTTFDLFNRTAGINAAIYYEEFPSVDTIMIKASDVEIYKETDEAFYNSYLPYRFGPNINTPLDRGWYMVNFNYLPGEHQPSGHINLSRAREFYLHYTSSFISSTNVTDLIVLSDAINFLLIRGGTAALRFAT